MARKFKELEARTTPDSIARSNATYKRLKGTMALEELRDAMRLTQQQLAKTLGVDQSAISKLERRKDMYVSTLDRFIKAIGGYLEIRAVFPAGSVRLKRLGKVTAEEDRGSRSG
jgi:transcriptional regulator with XRE-family HTH domain